MKKRVLAIILSLTLIIGVLSAPVMAEEKFSFNFDFLKQLTSDKESAEKEDTSTEKQAEDIDDVTLESNEIINTQGTTVAKVLQDDGNYEYFDTVQEAIDDAVTGITEPAQARTVELNSSLINLAEPLTIKQNNFVILDLKGCRLDAQSKCSVIKNEGTLTITDTNTNNSGCIRAGKAENGGGIYNTGKLTINGGMIECNDANSKGGGIYNSASGELIITLCHFHANSANSKGGAVYNEGKLEINSEIKNSQRTVKLNYNRVYNGDGGGIYNQSASPVVIKTVGIFQNTATQNGGAIYNAQGDLTLENSLIEQSTSDQWGGAVYNSGQLSLTNGTIINQCGYKDDKKALKGGGVFNCGTLTMEEDVVIQNCTADTGAGVYNDNADDVTFNMNDGKLINNIAQKNGGGVYHSEKATFNFNGGEISGNTATASYGGGVFTEGTLNLNGTVYLCDNTGNSTVSNLAVVKNHPIAFGDDFSGMVGLSLIEKQESSYVNNLTGIVTSNGDSADLEHLFADQSGTQKLECKDEKIELVATDKCKTETYTVSLDGIVAEKEYSLYLDDQLQDGQYRFKKMATGWYIQQKVDRLNPYVYVNPKNGKVVKEENAASLWKYDDGFYQEIETTKKFLWWDITKKTKYYLASTNEGAELSTTQVKATIKSSNTSVDEHPCRYTNITNTTHTAICMICGQSSVDGHSYDKNTHKCVCGKYHPDYAVTSFYNNASGEEYSTTWISKRKYNIKYNFDFIYSVPEDIAVENMIYSTDGGDTWKTIKNNKIKIKSFFKPISSFNILIKIKTTDGTTSLWNGICADREKNPFLRLTRINYYGD